MQKPVTNNLEALLSGFELTPYQRALAVQEYAINKEYIKYLENHAYTGDTTQ